MALSGQTSFRSGAAFPTRQQDRPVNSVCRSGTSLATSTAMLSTSACAPDSSVRLPQSTSPHIVAIGGGTGLPTVLRGLRRAADTFGWTNLTDNVTAIVTVMDDGGSSGQLRKSMGILPPGDIRNCLAAMVRKPSTLSSILHDRLPGEGTQTGHPIGNLLLAALTTSEGDFLRAIKTLSAEIGISGRVIPATLESVHLDGSVPGRGGDSGRKRYHGAPWTHPVAQARTSGSSPAGGDRSDHRCRSDRGWPGKPVYEHSSQPARRRHRRDALRRDCASRLRRQLDDRAR